jgi:hypothetical protein
MIIQPKEPNFHVKHEMTFRDVRQLNYGTSVSKKKKRHVIPARKIELGTWVSPFCGSRSAANTYSLQNADLATLQLLL